MKVKDFFKKVLGILSNLFFPEKIKCIFCGKDVPNFEEKPFCEHCQKTLPFNNGHKCKVCDSEIMGEGTVCDFCKSKHKAFDNSCAVFKYEGIIRTTVLRFKSDNAKYLAKPMAALMERALPENMRDFDLIVPVPLSAKSLKKRGYNQSALLANEIAKIVGKPATTDLLVKNRETLPQKTLSFKERQANLNNAFHITRKADIKNKTILLIDDVMTTSATANICSNLLKKHCKKVYVLVFARNTINFDKK